MERLLVGESDAKAKNFDITLIDIRRVGVLSPFEARNDERLVYALDRVTHVLT